MYIYRYSIYIYICTLTNPQPSSNHLGTILPQWFCDFHVSSPDARPFHGVFRGRQVEDQWGMPMIWQNSMVHCALLIRVKLGNACAPAPKTPCSSTRKPRISSGAITQWRKAYRHLVSRRTSSFFVSTACKLGQATNSDKTPKYNSQHSSF